jgi:hypothetical protein
MFLTRNRTDADCHYFENAYRRDTHTNSNGTDPSRR